MGQINIGRVVAGGLLAGLIINISEFVLNGVVLARETVAAMAALNVPPMGPGVYAGFVLAGFALGITTVWLYAAIRPRFGPGIPTAVCAALFVWFLAYVYPNIFLALIHLFPRRLIAIGTIWGLPELVIAGIAGAWAYKEP